MMRARMFALALAWMPPAPAAVVIDELPATGAVLTLADARDPDAGWRPAARDAAGSIRPRADTARWFRVYVLESARPGEYVFSLRAGRSFEFRLHPPPDYEPQSFFATDSARGGEFSERKRTVVLSRAPDAAAPVYLEVLRAAGRPVAVDLTPIREYRVADLAHTRFVYAALAAIVVLILVNFAIWLALRESVYLYFLGYMTGTATYVALASGEGYAMPVLEWFRYWSPHGLWFVAIVTAACGAAFLSCFINLKRFAPSFAQVLRVYAWLMIALSTLLLWPWREPQMWLATLGNVLLAVLAPLGLVAAALAWWRGSRYAWIYLLGWCPAVGFTVLRSLQLLGFAPDHQLGEYGYYGSTALAALVFTLGLAWRTVDLRTERDLAVAEAGIDPLTGLLNRRAMRAQFEVAFSDAIKRKQPVALLFMDLDHFKRINDEHGHAAGDACLENLAFVAQSELRLGDILGRYGGEEFAALLRDADAATALSIAEAIRKRLERDGAWFDGRKISYTVTIGAAVQGPQHASLDALFADADRLLYAGKRAGRNRVMLAGAETLQATA